MSSRAADVLVAVQRGGRERPFFFVAAAYRDIFAAAHLAGALGPEFPLYALQPPAAAGRHEVVLSHLADLVACYAAAVRGVQPRGPYRLGGYSSGGLIALELARALAAGGDAIELVALLEGGTGVPSAATYALIGACRRLAGGWRLSPRRGEPRPLRLLRSALTDGGMFATYTALRGHAPARYDLSPVALFAARSEGLTALRVSTGGWEKLMPGGLTVETVPGDHDSCMQPPHVAVLADRLRAHLAPAGRPTVAQAARP